MWLIPRDHFNASRLKRGLRILAFPASLTRQPRCPCSFPKGSLCRVPERAGQPQPHVPGGGPAPLPGEPQHAAALADQRVCEWRGRAAQAWSCRTPFVSAWATSASRCSATPAAPGPSPARPRVSGEGAGPRGGVARGRPHGPCPGEKWRLRLPPRHFSLHRRLLRPCGRPRTSVAAAAAPGVPVAEGIGTESRNAFFPRMARLAFRAG